ncbi:P-loop containing nucleoside triphosphate hydrolase protein [Gorgonomyces haynaldii]|nr:P-loop containing nucleoside triphosphate hydrolase protein [Gorgonomyces haynaldii]
MSSKQVEVYVRIRPHKSVKCVKSTGDTVHISNPRNSQEQINYTFTKVFSDQSKQENIFEHIRPQLDTIFQGTNVTLFAYGQTGSGKTHTINGSAKEPGMIPRTIGFLLAEIKQRKLDCKIAASYLEIYNEKIYDLLDASERTQSSHLDLRETQNKQIVVAGITVVPIHSIADFKRHHEAAMERRSTASTQLNEQSSRSHFIMQVHVTTKTDGKMCHSKLHMIDLAGSEDNKRTGNAGARMVESGAINKSLFVLGQVVESLNKNASRIPYRDSKITRFLQDSLGGSAIGMMIACLSPDEEHFIDTYNTLNFATKACNIKNTIQVNEMQEKTVEDRKQALQEWKSRKPGNDLKRRRSQETDKQLDEGKRLSDPKRLSDTQPAKRLSERNSLDERNDDKPRALKRFFTSGKSIEDQINEKVEQRLQQRLEEFKGTLFSPLRKDQSNFQNRLLEIEKRLEQKMKRALEDESQKENQQLEHIKENTRLRMLQIINTGSLKDLQQLKMIGKKRAQDIFEARQSFGEMSALEDLTRAGLSMHLIESIFKVLMIRLGQYPALVFLNEWIVFSVFYHFILFSSLFLRLFSFFCWKLVQGL